MVWEFWVKDSRLDMETSTRVRCHKKEYVVPKAKD